MSASNRAPHRRSPAVVGALLALVLAASTLVTACMGQDNELRQVRPGSTVWIDAWDDHGDTGDKAQVERKPSGLWVIPLAAPFSAKQGDGFDVKIALTREGEWQILEVKAGTKTRLGLDHDDCLEDGEAYARMMIAEGQRQFERDKGGGNDNDGCVTAVE